MTWLIDDFNSAVEAIGNFISLGLEITITSIFYPITMFNYWISNILNLIFEPFIEFNNNLMLWDNIIFDFIFTVLGSILPFTHAVIIFIAITIVLIYRIYHYIKDIHILGNSI